MIVFFIVQELGVNCIELMPCHEFNELEYYSYNAVLGDYKYIVPALFQIFFTVYTVTCNILQKLVEMMTMYTIF